MATQITAHYSIASRQGRNPVIPEPGTAADTVLEQNSIGLLQPWIGIVVDLVIHFAVVRLDLWHVDSPIVQRRLKSCAQSEPLPANWLGMNISDDAERLAGCDA